MTMLAVAPEIASCDLSALGVAVRLVVTEPASLVRARDLLERDLAALDLACSRFRSDSELVALNQADGRTVKVSRVLAEAIAVALDAARGSHGDVDPTLGSSLIRLGYDRDFAQLPGEGAPVALSIWRGSHWDQVDLDREARTVRMPQGVQLDLGATAKAWCADRVARIIRDEVGCGVLVSLGGDIAMAGEPPEGGWSVRVQDRPGPLDELAEGPSCTVSVRSGGLATSSTAARRWQCGGRVLHHLVDPRTGMPAVSVWRTVTVNAASCLEANVATTAAIVRSRAAVAGLLASGLAARLVDRTGHVTVLNGWPAEVGDEQR
jgi:thiamine biosynthesis lipoprotein ApbE